jgi:hypothetical protein
LAKLNIRHTLKTGGNDEGGYRHCCLNGMISGIDITRVGCNLHNAIKLIDAAEEKRKIAPRKTGRIVRPRRKD